MCVNLSLPEMGVTDKTHSVDSYDVFTTNVGKHTLFASETEADPTEFAYARIRWQPGHLGAPKQAAA